MPTFFSPWTEHELLIIPRARTYSVAVLFCCCYAVMLRRKLNISHRLMLLLLRGGFIVTAVALCSLQEVEVLTLYKSIVEDGPDLFSLHNPTSDAPFRWVIFLISYLVPAISISYQVPVRTSYITFILPGIPVDASRVLRSILRTGTYQDDYCRCGSAPCLYNAIHGHRKGSNKLFYFFFLFFSIPFIIFALLFSPS